MATVELVAGADAAGTVRDVYEDIKDTLGIDFVPNNSTVIGVHELEKGRPPCRVCRSDSLKSFAKA
jgi:hypothetical protein